MTKKEVIVGWRSWALGKPHFLTSGGWIWQPGQKLEAECHNVPHHHDDDDGIMPGHHCTCGIYAFNSLHQLKAQGYSHWEIFGEVYLWGKVITHTYGYRAQFAYPKKLYVQENRADYRALTDYEYLAWSFGVPIEFTKPLQELPDPSWAEQTRLQAQAAQKARLAQQKAVQPLKRQLDNTTRANILRASLTKKQKIDYEYLLNLQQQVRDAKNAEEDL